MERMTRKEQELQGIIDQQKGQLSVYAKKLRDVVQAYRGVLKEKEALEASLNALAGTEHGNKNQNSLNVDNVSLSSSREESVNISSHSSEDCAVAASPSHVNEEVEQLRAKVSTLSLSLQTITAEKSRIESSFQLDRKRLIQEKEDLEKSLAAACSQADGANETLEQQLSDIRLHLTNEKSERTKETANNQVMVRELQKKLCDERQKREALEIELSTRAGKLSQASLISNQLETAERRLKDLSNELNAARMKLELSEEKLRQPSPLLIQLQNEMAEMKAQHRLAIQQEQRNAAEAEEIARKLAASHEKRVVALEARLAELSETVGAYDRLRQQDLATVSKLKVQLCSLQKESSESFSKEADDEEDDAQALVDKMVSIKNRLLELANRSDPQFNANGLLERHGLHADHEACTLELQRVRHELDWHQQQQTQKRDEPKEVAQQACNDKELQQYRIQVQFLKNELEHNDQEYKDAIKTTQQSWVTERANWKEEMAQSERAFRIRLADLEQQLQKQRERSLSLLQEKDDEVNALRQLLEMKNACPISASNSAAASAAVSSADNDPASSAEAWPEDLAPLGSMAMSSSASGGQILHYVEELARKELEVQNLRRFKNRLEGSLREVQIGAMASEYKFNEEKDLLLEKISRLERNESREGANLEYLKNVLLEFFMHSDPSSQSHMFNAIAAILHFSPKEITRIRTQHPKWKIAHHIPHPPSSALL